MKIIANKKGDIQRIMTVRIPLEIWQELHRMKVQGKIESLQSATIDALSAMIEIEQEEKKRRNK
jgi:hypothetical protein